MRHKGQLEVFCSKCETLQQVGIDLYTVLPVTADDDEPTPAVIRVDRGDDIFWHYCEESP